MATNNPLFSPEPEWDEVFADPAVRSLTRCVPANKSTYHDETDDERVLQNMRQQAPWMKRIIAAAIAEQCGISAT